MPGFNLNGIRFPTLIALLVILSGGLVAYGEGRYRISDNYKEVQSLEQNHDEDFILLRKEQKELDGKVDTVIEQQGRMDERLKIIQEGQGRQERTTDLILQELRRRQPLP
ncbi:hypothetical protein LCGC14_2469620 [marine sediment metagenome]|uniref:Uncharacterized protein n=1 Tax=marine sediment metagenome TaxID=412755 RepID=A0A0F9BBE5_9ZZZZ